MDSTMPFAVTAQQASGQPADLLPPMPQGGVAPPQSMPMMPPVTAPVTPQYQAKMQADGSGVWVMPSPDGNSANDIVLGRIEPPKVPKALQQPPAIPPVM